MAVQSRGDGFEDGGYGAPHEDAAPLLPTGLSRALRRRLTELAGLVLCAVGFALALALGSHHPADPSFFNATSAPPRNWLGLAGATLSDPLARSLGLAAWGLPAVAGAWGLRLVTHSGAARALSRLVLAPFAVLAVAAALSAHVPPAGWMQPYGLGGLAGDAVGAALAGRAPWPLEVTALVLSLGLTAAALLLSGLAGGLDRAETGAALRWIGAGLVWASGGVARRAGHMAAAAARRLTRPRSARLTRPAPSFGEARRRAAAAETRPLPAGMDPDAEPPLTARGAPAGAAEPAVDPGDPSAEAAEAAGVVARLRAAALRPAPVVPEDDDADDDLPPLSRPLAAPPVSPPPRQVPVLSRRAQAEAQPSLALDDARQEAYPAPPLSLLQDPRDLVRPRLAVDALQQNARMLEAVLDDYGIRGEIVKVSPGPVVTLYELEPERGVKAARVIGLADDIARSMSALAARVSTVPGRSVIGIELPNDLRQKVLLRELLESRAFGDGREKLLLALGKDIAGEPVVANLARMPHLLIAGTTGSGKSVAINTMILSLLYRLGPEDCRMIMIDPKMLELSVYDGIPHLLSPVVTDPKKAVVALKWVVAEMEDRYRKMSRMGVRNIEGYNARVRDALARGEAFTRTVQTGFDDATGEPVFETEEFAPEALPLIVVVVDEMADLMMVAGKEIEACIQRLAQMARASGIHIIMATQRPSVDVITGTIKANFPTRISFQVTSKIDSRTILGEQGAEQLLGMGDMLYMAGGGRVTRIHGPFVSDEEVEEVVAHLKRQGAPSYVSGVTDGPDEDAGAEVDLLLGLTGEESEEQLYDRAVAIVARDRKCSTSYIQRKLAIGYQRAARLVEQMEEQGVIGPADKVGKRDILVAEV